MPPSPALPGVKIHPRGLLSRVLFLALLFVSELVAISTFLDSAALESHGGLPGLIRQWGPWVLRAIVGVSAIFATFIWLRYRPALDSISADLENASVGWALLASHATAMVAFAALSTRLYSTTASTPVASAWLAAGLAAIACAALAAIPARQWIRLVSAGGVLWAYAVVSIILACVAGNYSRALWLPTSRLTFTLAKWLLKPLGSALIVNPGLMALGTSRFRVIVSPECSGLEGAGLILAFGILWLVFFHRECRFPQSLLLIPAGILLLFFLNAARIAALLLIGDAGARQIAIGGFHSQAGWILFNAVAVGFCVTVRNVSWFTAQPARPAPAVHPENPTAAYLVPFLAILAAGMVAAAASGGFEWLYPLRLAASGAALWMFRRYYAKLNWRASWSAVALGVIVFGLWLGLDRLLNRSASSAMPAALAAAGPSARASWIALRTIAAIVTVPLAEELAFRGYLMRRLVSADFESAGFGSAGWIPMLASSAAFGLLHRGHVAAGFLSGLLLAAMIKRRGSMGDIVVAHAVANMLLAVGVLAYAEWQLW